jgi:RHS repeat-associated protein
VTDPQGSTSTHEYNASDCLSRRIDPLGKAEIFSSDGNGNLTSTTDRKTQTATFTYDALNRRTQASYQDGSVATFTYDAGDRLSSADDTADPHRPITFTSDPLDRLLTETTSLGTVTYTYEAFGRTETAGTPNPNAFRFTGREDDDTGLYYYRARYYDPTRSRFVSEGPIGFAGRNLYSYVRNGPQRKNGR